MSVERYWVEPDIYGTRLVVPKNGHGGKDQPYNRFMYVSLDGRLWRVVGLWFNARREQFEVDPGDTNEQRREWRSIGHTARRRRLAFDSAPHPTPTSAEEIDAQFARAREVGPPEICEQV